MSKFPKETKKNYNAIFSDDESDEESEFDLINNVMVLTTFFKEIFKFQVTQW